MHRKILTLIWVAVFLTIGNKVEASSSSGTATAVIADPTGAGVVSDLAFGTLVPAATAGTVIISTTDIRTKTGNLILVNSVYHSALFILSGTVNRTYNITLPKNKVVTIRNAANASMAVNNFSENAHGGGSHKFDASGHASFNVGGTLEVGANQPPGVYTGTFIVDIKYN